MLSYNNTFWSLPLEGGQFPCTDDCQVTFVNLKCDSSKKRRRGRKSPSKEVSHITAEFEMEMKEEEASGIIFSTPPLQNDEFIPYRIDGGALTQCLPQTRVTWTACGRGWSRSCRAPCGRSGSPSTNSSSTSSSLGPSTRWLRNRPECRREPRPAAPDTSSGRESVVSLFKWFFLWVRVNLVLTRGFCDPF